MHGLHVSPEGNGDNVFVSVEPGGTFDYEYKLPGDHPPGVYWYHPHHHGMVADQIFAGLFGAIIVEDPEPIEASAERVLVISDTTLDGLGNIPEVPAMERMMGREGELILVNGQSNPQFSARPGQRERWRIINTCVSRYLRYDSTDSSCSSSAWTPAASRHPRVWMNFSSPGNRADLLVTTTPGTSVLRALYQNRGNMPGMMGPGSGARNPAHQPDGAALATLRVAGEPVAALTAVPAQQGLGDLRSAAVAARRQIILAAGMGMGMGEGHDAFHHRRQGIQRGQNRHNGSRRECGGMDADQHQPHGPPVPPARLADANHRGKRPRTNTAIWQDVVNVPANGRVKVRVAFKDFRGRSVYHCHILDHEDLGMMGAIEVR